MIPKLRFPEFEDDYTKETLGAVSKDISYGIGAAAKPYDFEYRYLRITDIDESSFTNLTDGNSVSPNCSQREAKEYILDKGDVVLARTGASVGKMFLNTKYENLVYAGFLIRFKVNSKALPYYLTTSLQTQRYNKWVSIMSVRSGQPGINAKEYSRYPLNLPSLQEQKRVSSLFASLDQKINLLTKKKEALETYKKGLMQKIFSQELRFKREDGTDYTEWRRVKLGDIQEFKNGRPTEPYWCEDGKYEVITLNSVSIKGELKASGRTTDFYDNSLRKGDLVMVLSDIAHANLLGLCDVIPNEGFILNQRMGRLRVAVEIDPYFLRYAINRQQKYFKRRGQGTSQKHIYQRDVDSLTIELPCLDEQIKITETLKSIDLVTKRIYDAVSQTSKMKKGLLQQMFV